eukprot:5226-Heterococcus_DN1.PRE.1
MMLIYSNIFYAQLSAHATTNILAAHTLTLDEDVLQCYSEYAAGGPLALLMQQLIQLSGDAPTSTNNTTTSSSAKRSSAEKRRASTTPQKPSDFIRGAVHSQIVRLRLHSVVAPYTAAIDYTSCTSQKVQSSVHFDWIHSMRCADTIATTYCAITLSLAVPAGAAAAQQGVVFTAGRWVPSNGSSSNGCADDGFTSASGGQHRQQLQHRRASVAVGDSDRLLRKNVILQRRYERTFALYCIGSSSNAVYTAIGASSLTPLKLQALAIADDDGTSDRLTAVERELLHHMINTEHDLVVTAFEVYRSSGDVLDLGETLLVLPQIVSRKAQSAFANTTSLSLKQRTVHTLEQGSSYDDSETVEGATTVNDDDAIDDAIDDTDDDVHEQDDLKTLTLAALRMLQGCASVTAIHHLANLHYTALSQLPCAQYQDDDDCVEEEAVHVGSRYTDRFTANSYTSELPQEQQQQQKQLPLADVREQLTRVVASCAQLLRLRGALTSRGELALAAMAKRHSPALLAAIEAYGANQ